MELAELHIGSDSYEGQTNNWQQSGAIRPAKSGIASSGWESQTITASSKPYGGWSSGQNRNTYRSGLDGSSQNRSGSFSTVSTGRKIGDGSNFAGKNRGWRHLTY